MWYEIIPTTLIIMAGVGLPQHAIVYIYNRWTNNTVYRMLNDSLTRHLYLRDQRLTDNPLTAGDEGLKGIPDD